MVAAAAALIAIAYGLVRFAYGLYLPDVQQELGMDAATAGLVASGASVAYCVGALLGLRWGDRAPRGLAIAAGAVAAIGAAGMAAAADAAAFVPSAIASSAAAGLASPAVVGLVDRNVRAARDQAQAIANAGTGPGLALAGALALVVLPSWRTAWALTAVAAVVVTIALVLADRGAAGGGPGAGEPVRSPHEQTSASSVRWMPWLGTHRIPMLAAALLGAGSAPVWTYGRQHLAEQGAAGDLPIVAWIAIGVGGVVAALVAGRVARLDPRTAWATTTIALAVATATLGPVAASAPAMLLVCGLFGAAYVLATGALIAWSHRIDAARAAAGTAVLFVAMMLGQAIGSAVAGVLADGVGLQPVLVGAAAVAVVGAAVGAADRLARRASPALRPDPAPLR